MANGFVSALSKGGTSLGQPTTATAYNAFSGHGGTKTYNIENYTPNASQPYLNPSFRGAYNGHTAADPNLSLMRDQQGNLGWYRKPTAANNESVMLGAKQFYANQFQQNIPGMESKLGYELGNNISDQMNHGIKNLDQSNSRRGLLYGGVNAGGEGAIRAQAAGQMARGRSSINKGLLDASNKMNAGTIDFGVQIQQQQQAIQDSLYRQAMADAAGAGAVVGDVLGAAGAVVGTIYGGGVGGAAGYAAGKGAGSALT